MKRKDEAVLHFGNKDTGAAIVHNLERKSVYITTHYRGNLTYMSADMELKSFLKRLKVAPEEE